MAISLATPGHRARASTWEGEVKQPCRTALQSGIEGLSPGSEPSFGKTKNAHLTLAFV